MEKNKKGNELDLGDDMLGVDGVIVEPDVRLAVKKYLRAMGLRETVYPIRATFFSNPYEDAGEEFLPDPTDPVGLKSRDRSREVEEEIMCIEALRSLIRKVISEGFK